MQALKKMALGAVVLSTMALAGCASRYDDGYYDGYRDDSYYDHSGHYYQHNRGDRSDDRHDRDDWRSGNDRDDWRGDSDRGERVRVCDADGDNCHWEYRRP